MALAFRAIAVNRPSSSPPPTKPTTPSSKSCLQQQRRIPLLLQLSPTPVAAISLLALLSTPDAYCEAKAIYFTKEDIASSLTKVEDTIDKVGDVSSKALDFTGGAFKVLTDAIKPAVDVALPVLQSAGNEALKIASPVVTDASKQAKDALQSVGIDPSPVVYVAKTVADALQQTPKFIEGAKPIASATVETITSSEPSVIVVSAGALFLAYLLLPPVWSVIAYNFRGYQGNVSAPQALDMISTQNYLLIDIRSEKDKNKAGIPRLPSDAKNKMISVPLEEIPSKIKGLVRNVKRVEAEMVAVKISYLKRVNKGSKIVIMDSYSDAAKIVAKTLTSLGFKNCWVVTGGFSGGRGWSQSRLGTDSYNVSITEIVSPSRIIPAATRFGTTGSAALPSTRKLLPGSTNN